MKLLFFLRDISDCGGIQQTTCNIINNLFKKLDDVSITVLSLYNKNKANFFELSNKAKCISIFDGFVDLRIKYFDIKKKVSNIVNSLDFDLLIVQGAEYSIFLKNSIWKKKKVIVCEHCYIDYGHIMGIHYRGVKKALKLATAIISLTKLDSLDYKARQKNKNQIISNIPNPCSFDIPSHVSYNQNSNSIVSCGSLVELKRFDHVVLAAKELLSKRNDWKWYIYGDGSEKAKLESMINESGLNDYLILKGYEKDKDVIYGDKAFLVLTSKFEGFGMVILEAMRYSLPVISYDIKYGPREIIKNEYNGLLIEESNPIKLAESIDALMSNKNRIKELSQNALKSTKEYEIGEIINRWISLFNKCLEKEIKE